MAKRKIIVVFTLVLFIVNLLAFKAASANEPLFPFIFDGVKIDFEKQGKPDRLAEVEWSDFTDIYGRPFVSAVTFYEQSKYAPLEPERYYYRTKYYTFALSRFPFLIFTFEHAFLNYMYNYTVYDVQALQGEESKRARQVIESKFKGNFNTTLCNFSDIQ